MQAIKHLRNKKLKNQRKIGKSSASEIFKYIGLYMKGKMTLRIISFEKNYQENTIASILSVKGSDFDFIFPTTDEHFGKLENEFYMHQQSEKKY